MKYVLANVVPDLFLLLGIVGLVCGIAVLLGASLGATLVVGGIASICAGAAWGV